MFIVQARPETVQSQKSSVVLRTYSLQKNDLLPTAQLIVSGQAVGESIAQGKVRVVEDFQHMRDFQPGEVLVAKRTDPDWEPIMKRASALVTDQGGRTCHAAIIAREMGIPAVVGCGNATGTLQYGQLVTVSCADGEVGKIYEGRIPFTVEETELESVPRTRTKILMNVGNPEEVLRLAAIPCDGVGLARLEFIIANQIKIHPLALLHYETLTNSKTKQSIAELTSRYAHKPGYFIDKLSQGIGLIASAFYPKPVIIRLSDFKSNEYRQLLGGELFEPIEENPMLGWRGASRYTDPNYQAAFELECLSLVRTRNLMGLTNIIPMIPFCRTPEEGQKVLEKMAEYGLVKGENGLEVYVMCEVPNNVILAEQFSEVFDGFSIGSNDLTQLTLGLDRDSALIAHLFDERSEGVKAMVNSVIKIAKEKGRKTGICGQAPSDYPEFARFLVHQGIDSISLNPDSIIKTTLAIAEIEKQQDS
jgi:pyruvate, water dikinase